MILSMTGFGEAHCSEAGVSYALEVRSVNNRYFKANIKLPDGTQFVEPQIDKRLRRRINRGSVVVVLRLRNESVTAAYDINSEALSAYADAIGRASPVNSPNTSLDLATLATLPGVCQPPEMDDGLRQRRNDIILELLDKAVTQLVEMRRREGQSLQDDLTQQCRSIKEQLKIVESRAPTVLVEYHERLSMRVERLLANGSLDLDRDAIAREVAIYAERCDISEEIVRLRAHLEHFLEACDSQTAVGRKLDFLAQEMLRETNTLGSKSSDAEIARAVVEMKLVIDRIKEQAQNAE